MKQYAFLVLRARGGIEIIQNGDDNTFTLAKLHRVIDGMIEIVRPESFIKMRPDRGDIRMIVDDEGKLKGLPVNVRATFMYSNLYMIVGDAIICKQIMTDEGPDVGAFDQTEAIDLTNDLLNFLRRSFHEQEIHFT